ncbi:MAG: LysM peptidoglycan-binding domain-containing protein [Hyphomicrobiaceae bacterium]
MASVERLSGPVALLGTGLLLSACSADVTRFDFPAFGLGNNGTTTAALPAPPEPLYQYEKPKTAAAKTQKRLPKYGKQTYQVAQADTGISRSNLGRPDDGDWGARPTSPRPAPLPSYSDTTRPSATETGATVVKRGDTLYGISRRTGVSVSRIREANNLVGSNIRIGQKLVIPRGSNTFAAPKRRVETTAKQKSWTDDEPKTTASVGDRLKLDAPAVRPVVTKRAAAGSYRVKAGDSLYAISRRVGVSAKTLAEANNIYDPSRLRVGQVLTIPGQGSAFGTEARYENTGATTTRRVEPKPRQVASLRKSDGFGSDTVTATRPLSETSSETRFRWPVRGRIISRFGSKTQSGNNDGVNFAVPEGTSVKAVEDGVVAYAGGELKGYGQLLLVRHDDDWVSAYAHNSKLLAKRGDKVRRGQIIAKAGRTGSVDRPQVHFELRKGSKPVDPLKHLASNYA